MTKIYHCWVYSISRQGIEELGSCFGSILLLFLIKVSGGVTVARWGGGGGVVETPANSDSPACSQAMSGKRHLMELLYLHPLVR